MRIPLPVSRDPEGVPAKLPSGHGKTMIEHWTHQPETDLYRAVITWIRNGRLSMVDVAEIREYLMRWTENLWEPQVHARCARIKTARDIRPAVEECVQMSLGSPF